MAPLRPLPQKEGPPAKMSKPGREAAVATLLAVAIACAVLAVACAMGSIACDELVLPCGRAVGLVLTGKL